MHKFPNFKTVITLKLLEMVTFSREKSFLDFCLVYNRFCFKFLQPIHQKLEMVIFGHFK